ncbi:MAG: T9SS type A sorting domain-containing protein [Bacteroidales bacterium]|nr:T9SS type A sorting domain-containing protein [Bacteroidales bacterium]
MKNIKFYTMLAFLLMAGGVTMQAQITCWDGSVAEAYAGGDGTTGNPYQIATAEQLALLAQQTNTGSGGNACYILTDSICLNGSEGYMWQPIGTEEYAFTGCFDGNQFAIKDMYITNAGFSGLFGNTLNATVRNVRVTEAMDNNVNPQGADGLVVGKATNTNIINCVSMGLMNGIASKQGGIVGHFIVDTPEADTIFLKDCVNHVNLYGMLYAGGIAGYSEITNGVMSIEHCVNLGNITNGVMCGGIVGAGSFSIRHCDNYGMVSSNSISGGIVGQRDDFGEIVFCTNHDKASIQGEIAGGIAGAARQTKIAMCANRAKVTAQGDSNDWICAGGIAGADGKISNCYNRGNVECLVLYGQPEVVQMGGITGTGGNVVNVYNTGAIIPPENPHTNNAWYGIIAAGLSDDPTVCHWYWFGEYDINPYGFDWPYYLVPGSCAFNEGASATTWILDEAQYGTTDLTEALNLGAMNECIWKEDEDLTNDGFPVFGAVPPVGLAEQKTQLFDVYPNPTNGVLFVETRFIASPSQTYRITNLLGQTLQSGRVGGEMHQIDVSGLPSGMYLLNLDGATVKFVVK